ncbi:MAG: isomerase [Pedobacter sp.]
MNTQITIEESVRQYTHAWNQESPAAIREALSTCWSDNSTYIDPQTSMAIGVDQLVEVIYNSYKELPQRKFNLVSQADCHHGRGRFSWELIMANQDVVEGMDYFEFNEKNQITSIVGFFGPLL